MLNFLQLIDNFLSTEWFINNWIIDNSGGCGRGCRGYKSNYRGHLSNYGGYVSDYRGYVSNYGGYVSITEAT